MSTTPWRGTLIFAGGIAAIAATAVTRFAGADVAGLGVAAGTPAGAAGTTSVPAAAGTSSGTTGAGAVSGAAGASSSGTPSATADPAATPTAQPAAAGGAVTIVGSTVQTRYGPVQLSVTFDGSDITDVQALQSPGWHGESVQINAYAIPVLNQEAVAQDSAKIDTVSGATITSGAYKQSLQAAIDQRG